MVEVMELCNTFYQKKTSLTGLVCGLSGRPAWSALD